MTLEEVADKFGLDTVFSYYPEGSRVDDLAVVAYACTDFFSHDDWQLCEKYEEYAYISASAIIDLVVEEAESFFRYYKMVDA